MPDYNPAVALDLKPPENSLAQTFNTIANLQQTQAHTGLYQLQAQQQARQYNALQQAAASYRGGQDPTAAYLAAGGDPAGANTLQTVFAGQRAMAATPGGLMPQAFEQLTGAAKNRQETSNLGVQHQVYQTDLAKKDMEFRGGAAQSMLNDPGDENWNANAANLRGHVSPQGWAQIQGAKTPEQRKNVAQSMIDAATPTQEFVKPVPMQPGEGFTTVGRLQARPAAGAPSPMAIPAMTPGGKKQQEQFAEQGVAHYKEAQEKSSNAATAQYGLGELENNLNALPPGSGMLTPGTGFGKRLALAKAVNTAFQGSIGWTPFDQTQVAAGEAAQKGTTRLGFDTAKILGSRESQMIVQQAVGIQPGGQMTPAANARIIPALTAAAQREKDYFKFLNTYTKDNPNALPGEAQIQFNEQHPPSQYVADVSKLTAIKQGYGDAIKDLRANPKLAKDFDLHFGAGMSRYFLGN